MTWLDSVAERRFMVALLVIGVVFAGYVVHSARRAWRKAADLRERRRPTPNTPVYAGTRPGPYAVALWVGALRAVAVEEAVDRLDYGRSRKRARALLSADTDAETARAAVPRALRALLGGDAENPGPGLALVEEALRQRERVGPELWHHALEEFATARGLPYGERESLQSLAVDIGRAEDRLRMEGVLGLGERVPSLLACHWAEGVHVARAAMKADWQPRAQGLEYLARAGELATRWYPNLPVVLAAQLLPPLLNDDATELAWRLPATRKLLTECRFRPVSAEVFSGHGGRAAPR